MIPQAPFTTTADCPICESHTHQELEFISWVIKDQIVYSKLTCHFCKGVQMSVMDEMDYEDLQIQELVIFHNLN